MSPFYTRKGDDGFTRLLGEGRFPKNDDRLEALGTIDEVSAVLGLARSLCAAPEIPSIILHVQGDLYKLMGELAATPDNSARFQSIKMSMYYGWKSRLKNLTMN
jgi:cob(I)alamin adenosyltransferase